MAKKPPPIPPDERDPQSEKQRDTKSERGAKPKSVPENLREQDQHGNTYQNTHNQGYQQDR